MFTIVLLLRTFLVSFLLLVGLPSALTRAAASTSPLHPATMPVAVSTGAVGDRILGRWYFAFRESDIEIYRENGHYFAKIVAVSQATTDKFGTMLNKMLLTDLTFAKNEWAGGQLIHPQTGNRFDVFLRLTDPNTLVITAYKGCRLFSRAYTLTRV